MELLFEAKHQIMPTENDTEGEDFKQQPFIQLKSCFKGHDNLLTGIVISETLLEVLGHTIDSFVSIVLREGLPEYHMIIENVIFNVGFCNCSRPPTHHPYRPSWKTTQQLLSQITRLPNLTQHC